MRVRSGSIRVDADFELVSGKSLDLNLAPGQSESLMVEMSDGREGGDDVSLAAHADIRLTLAATAVKAGDDRYPASVEATLGTTR